MKMIHVSAVNRHSKMNTSNGNINNKSTTSSINTTSANKNKSNSITTATNATMSTNRSQSDLNPPGEPSFNEILINTVREYPALYSTARRPYDGVDRQLIWKEVAKRIGRDVSPEFAKKRWLQLRDRYRKELKIAIAQNFSQPQKWNHFALLKWLDPHLQGNVPMTANADAHASSSSSLDNMNNLSCLDELFKTHNSSQASASSSLADYAADLMAHAQTSIPVDTTESDSLDDVKPMLSTIQSVLAATEVKLANDQTAVSSVASNTNRDTDNNMGNAFENIFSIENATSKQFDAKQSEMQFNSRSSVSLSSSSSVNNDNINDNQLMSSTGSNDNVSSNKHSSVIDTNRLNQPETIRAHPKMNNDDLNNERGDDCNNNIIMESPNSPDLSNINCNNITAGFLDNVDIFSNASYSNNNNMSSNNKYSLNLNRCRTRTINKSHNKHRYTNAQSLASILNNHRNNLNNNSLSNQLIRSLKQQTQQQSNDILQSPSSSITPSINDWFNNEEMLFARIVGLRLLKMQPSTRKLVRTRIMNILDEEIIDQDTAEAGTSVAE